VYNFRDPGQYYMAETGLNQNVNRDYDSLTGRYIESDLIGLAGGVNTYAYVLSDPVSLTDPFGLRALTECEKNLLRPYIPDVDLNNADLHDGKVPWYLGKQFAGITRGNDIYFRPGVYDPTSADGIAMLGHELVHVGQYRDGMTWLSYLWESLRHGYDNNKYEIPAYAKQRLIQQDLEKAGSKGCDPCNK